MNIIKPFIVGSSSIVTLLFYLVYFSIPKSIKALSNEYYAIIAPIFFGITNIIFVNLLQQKIINKNILILLISVLSASLVFTVAFFSGAYNFQGTSWILYFLLLWIMHYVAYNILYVLDDTLL